MDASAAVNVIDGDTMEKIPRSFSLKKGVKQPDPKYNLIGIPDDQNGLILYIPKGWDYEYLTWPPVFRAAPDTAGPELNVGNLELLVSDFNPAVKLDTLLQDKWTQFKQGTRFKEAHPDSTFLVKGVTTIHGKQARWLKCTYNYSFGGPRTDFDSKLYVFSRGKKAYFVDCAYVSRDFQNWEAMYDRMVESILFEGEDYVLRDD